jgi:hypothetical protein
VQADALGDTTENLGLIETADGDEVYFHQNSVFDGDSALALVC